MAQIEAATSAAEAESPRDAEAKELWRTEQALLDQMQRIAEDTRHLPDSKMRRLIDWIREHMCPYFPAFGKTKSGDPAPWSSNKIHHQAPWKRKCPLSTPEHLGGRITSHAVASPSRLLSHPLAFRQPTNRPVATRRAGRQLRSEMPVPWIDHRRRRV